MVLKVKKSGIAQFSCYFVLLLIATVGQTKAFSYSYFCENKYVSALPRMAALSHFPRHVVRTVEEQTFFGRNDFLKYQSWIPLVF